MASMFYTTLLQEWEEFQRGRLSYNTIGLVQKLGNASNSTALKCRSGGRSTGEWSPGYWLKQQQQHYHQQDDLSF